MRSIRLKTGGPLTPCTVATNNSSRRSGCSPETSANRPGTRPLASGPLRDRARPRRRTTIPTVHPVTDRLRPRRLAERTAGTYITGSCRSPAPGSDDRPTKADLERVAPWRVGSRRPPHETVVDAEDVLLGDHMEAELLVQHDVAVDVGFQVGGRPLLVDHGEKGAEQRGSDASALILRVDADRSEVPVAFLGVMLGPRGAELQLP